MFQQTILLQTILQTILLQIYVLYAYSVKTDALTPNNISVREFYNLKLLLTSLLFQVVTSEAKKYTIKILAKYNMEICLNKTFIIDTICKI